MDWGPTPETLAGCPHLKPQVSVHREQKLAASRTGPKRWTSWPCGTQDHSCRWASPTTQAQSFGPAGQVRPRPQSSRSANQRTGCLPGTTPKSTNSEQLLPSPCAQSPAGPTGSLGLRQNTQQRGAAGLGETAFPGKTQPSRGLNYPIAAPRAPSI